MKLHLELWMFEKYDRVLIPKETTEITFGDSLNHLETTDTAYWWRRNHMGKKDVYFWLYTEKEISGYTNAGYNTSYNHTITYDPTNLKANLRKAIRMSHVQNRTRS